MERTWTAENLSVVNQYTSEVYEPAWASLDGLVLCYSRIGPAGIQKNP